MAINTRCKASLFSVDLVVEITRSTASQTVPIAPWIASIDPRDTKNYLSKLSLSWNGICVVLTIQIPLGIIRRYF